ncbi:reverse transcriptase N-terminal domain-containing protein [Nostocaceae cyanobacterium CENA369]|uniref:Reverse transcriptase N-terminal domain-containing protein n=1 Tax=Dendronalium phyllosphericum CENA369 TaxID=1725256 RepID=A0A8J7LG65_9NOST|nr:reverse transcriptase N-terminal domain-containing protein [Dendronalium phyllosphericum]MBH8574564.1 reverse transcriptase N-terminal domain-containing protein [Dendronalium phyllosphericum CENA369]
MIRHSSNTSESWMNLPWKKFRCNLFRLQKRVFKAVREGNKRKAMSLQKLILRSRAARLLAIRQVSQLNAGKKTAGIDGKKSLTVKGRFELEELLKASSNNWFHQKLRSIPIPKRDGSTRMLKIPTIADRAWQCLAKYALEPAHEALFHERWHFQVQSNGKFRCTPSVENYKKFRQKVKTIVNCSNYGSKEKAEKLAPIVRGWRNYHKFCKMDGARHSLWYVNHRTWIVFNKETKATPESTTKLIKKAFPAVPHSENKHVNVKGNKSPYDGDITYWSERNSKLYDNETSKALKRQNHTCGHCGLKCISEEQIHLHHIDGNHNNWKTKNLAAVHESCHDYIHMGKSSS